MKTVLRDRVSINWEFIFRKSVWFQSVWWTLNLGFSFFQTKSCRFRTERKFFLGWVGHGVLICFCFSIVVCFRRLKRVETKREWKEERLRGIWSGKKSDWEGDKFVFIQYEEIIVPHFGFGFISSLNFINDHSIWFLFLRESWKMWKQGCQEYGRVSPKVFSAFLCSRRHLTPINWGVLFQILNFEFSFFSF